MTPDMPDTQAPADPVQPQILDPRPPRGHYLTLLFSALLVIGIPTLALS